MEAIIKYSKLIEDDGGFDKLRKDLEELGNDLKKKATEMTGVFNIVDPNSKKSIQVLQDQIEELKNSYKELAETNKLLQKTEKEYIGQKKKTEKVTENSLKQLDELNMVLGTYTTALKSVSNEEKKGNLSLDEASKTRGRLNLVIKETKKAINEEQKSITEGNKLTKKQQNLIKAQITLENKRISTMDEIYDRMKALRVVIKATNLTTKEGRDAVAVMNTEIEELSEIVKENSDKFIQNKMNIGNYKDSILEALGETDAFKTGIVALDKVMNKMLVIFKKSTKKTEQNTKANKNNAKSIGGLRKAFKGLGTALKATGILLVIGLMASFVSVFKQGRAGVIKTEKAMAIFNASIKVLINTGADLFKGFEKWMSSFGTSFTVMVATLKKEWINFKLAFTFGDKAKKLEKESLKLGVSISKGTQKMKENAVDGWNLMGDAISSFSKRMEDAKKSISSSFKGIIDTFTIGDDINIAKLQLISLKKELTELEMASDDATTGLRSQLEATRLALIKGEEVALKEQDIARMQVALTNAKARADLEASATTIGASAQKVLAIKDEIKFAEALLQLNKDLGGETNPLDNNLLQEQQDALREYKEKTVEFDAYKLSSAKKEREIKRDLFEQDLHMLIELIDKDKNIAEQYVNDISKNFKSRVAEMQAFLKKFMKTTSQEMDLFTRTAKDQELDLEFEIKYNEDGSFDVLMNKSKLSLDNIKKLNEELKESGLSKTTITDFKEFVKETRDAQKDFKDINKSLGETNLLIKELKGESIIDKEELELIKKINKEYSTIDIDSKLSSKEKKAIIEKIKKLEEERTKIQQKADEKRLLNRIKSIDRELKEVEKGSLKQIELSKEKTGIETQLEQNKFDKLKEGFDKIADKKSEMQKFGEDLKEIFSQVLDKFIEVSQKQVEITENRIDKQEDMVDSQRDRAEKGLTNTLAFEQKELAKREADKIKAEEKLEKAEMVKSLWTSYSANSSNKDVKNPILKTLKDFAILRAFTMTFGDGGLAEDMHTKVPTNGRGITRGRSHKGRNGGIPVLIEGNEGFFSGLEVGNLGKDNFYAIKELAGRGPVRKDLFKNQRSSFESTVNIFNDRHIVSKLSDVEKAINNRPEQKIDVQEMVNGILHLTETTTRGNSIVRNHYRLKKSRL